MNQNDVMKFIVDCVKNEMTEAAYTTQKELGQSVDFKDLFEDTLTRFLGNIGYEIALSNEKIIREVKHKVNGLLDIDDSDEVANDTIAEGERALDAYLSSSE